MDLKDIKAIIDLMKKNSISEFEMERQDFKIRLKRGLTGGGSGGPAVDEVPVGTGLPMLAAASAGPAALPTLATIGANDMDIKSPMIGTFYRAPSPESAPYVEVGSQVGPDTVVCIIEAMKVMNEIKAEVKGVISQVCLENGKPVEFGQPLFKIRPI